MLPQLNQPRILDAGCGEGNPAMELVGMCDGHITGLDIDRESLNALQKKAEAAGVADRIDTVQGSLFDMPFEDGSFDIVWSEATLHIVGVENGLKLWRKFLKPEGFLVIHEVVWLRDDPPQEALEYWRRQFPDIQTAAQYVELITSCGYDLIGHFNLPEDLWWDDYFGPLEKRIGELRGKYAEDRQALKTLDKAQEEVEVHRKYSQWFGSGFFIAQRRN
jgi:ubiquinone/menaquinone biosynthesis C-methylase UbiE